MKIYVSTYSNKRFLYKCVIKNNGIIKIEKLYIAIFNCALFLYNFKNHFC